MAAHSEDIGSNDVVLRGLKVQAVIGAPLTIPPVGPDVSFTQSSGQSVQVSAKDRMFALSEQVNMLHFPGNTITLTSQLTSPIARVRTTQVAPIVLWPEASRHHLMAKSGLSGEWLTKLEGLALRDKPESRSLAAAHTPGICPSTPVPSLFLPQPQP